MCQYAILYQHGTNLHQQDGYYGTLKEVNTYGVKLPPVQNYDAVYKLRHQD